MWRRFSQILCKTILILFFASPAFSAVNIFDSIAISWENIDTFVTLGQCASGPVSAALYQCHPAHLADVKSQRFDASLLMVATDSVFGLTDAIMNFQPSSDLLNKGFSQYNYTELNINPQIYYVNKDIMLGISPIRLGAQFSVHNPSLPLASVFVRQETNVFAGAGTKIPMGDLSLEVGGTFTFVNRRQIVAETTLLEFASRSPSDIYQDKKTNGLFADLGAVLYWKELISVSILAKDIGAYFNPLNLEPYLFIQQDRTPRIYFSASVLPKLWNGRLQIGTQLITLLDSPISYLDQLIGTVSYYLGPLKILSAFRPGLLRTGIGLRYGDFEASVGQEWINRLEIGRPTQPRFILGAAYGL